MNTLWPVIMVMVGHDSIIFHSQRVFKIPKQNDKTSTTTILRKWTSVCLTVDFEKQLGQVAYNGILSKKEKPTKDARYKDKYGGEETINDMKNPANNFTVIVGRYFFDKLSIVGKMVAINAWNRTLTEQEMVDFTSCSKILEAEGNLINKKTSWLRTAPLVEKYEVDTDEMVCSEIRQAVPAFLPIGGLTKAAAVDLCHKFGADIGLGGEFQTEEDYEVFYNLVWSDQSKRFRDEDDFLNRGRVYVWVPYTLQTINGTNKVLHDKTGTELGVNAWYSKEMEENARLRNLGKDILFGVMGIVPYKGNLEWATPEWGGMSTSCLLYNSFHGTTTVNIRGLCEHSSFDTIYMVEYTR